MKTNKIAVYTICKNEIDYVDKVYGQYAEADAVFVLILAQQMEQLKNCENGVGQQCLKKIINPWDFSKGKKRNSKINSKRV